MNRYIEDTRIKISFVVLLSICLLVLPSCSRAPYKDKSYRKITPSEEISVEYSLLHQDGQILKIKFFNHSGKSYSYGNGYYVEYDYKGEWYTIPTDKVWGLIGNSYVAGREIVNTYDTREMYGQLSDGHYRFIQTVILYDYEDGEEIGKNTYDIAVEFYLEKENSFFGRYDEV